MEVTKVGRGGGWAGKAGRRVWMPRCSVLSHTSQEWLEDALYSRVRLKSVTLDAKSFVTLWPSKGPILCVCYFFDLSLVLLPLCLVGNDDRYTHGLEISSIGHYCLHQKSCYTPRSLMDDSSENGFPGRNDIQMHFLVARMFSVVAVSAHWHMMIKPLGFHHII